MKNVARLIEAKSRDRNSASGTSGSRPPAIRNGNAIEATTPTPIAAHATGSFHSLRLAADQPEREAADGERSDERAEPVEPAGRLRVARLGDVADASPTARPPGAGR